MTRLGRALAGAIIIVMSAVTAHAQWQVPNHAVPIGKGSGTGFGNVPPAATGSLLGSQGMSSDPAMLPYIPSAPVRHPSTGATLACSLGHFLPFTDQNFCLTGDRLSLDSTSPDGLATLTPGGADPTTGAGTITVTFTFGAGACAAGCNAAFAQTAGMTLQAVMDGLVAAVKANASLYNDVAGAQGKILQINALGGTLNINYDIRTPMAISRTIGGTSSVTLAIGNGCAVACDKTMDTNPLVLLGRLVSGQAPVSGSRQAAILFQGNTSNSLTAFDINYAGISVDVLNSTSGAASSRINILTTNITGSLAQGIHVSAGLYTPARTDKGANTANFSELWTADVNSITRSVSTWPFNATTGDKIQFLSGDMSVSVNSSGFALDVFDSTSPTIVRVGLGGPAGSLGQLTLCGNTLGCGTLTPTASPNGIVWTLPAITDTLAGLTSPTFITRITTPKVDGGAAAASTLTLESTSGAGTTDAIIFNTASQVERMRILTGGQVAIGTSVPVTNSLLTVSNNPTAPPDPGGATQLQILGANGGNVAAILYAFGNQGALSFIRANNTNASPTAVAANDVLGIFGFAGYNGSAYTINRARVVGYASEAWTTIAQGSYLGFETTATGSVTRAEAMRVQPSGGISIGTTTDPGSGTLLTLKGVQSGTTTVGSLPTCNAAAKAQRYFVTDSNAASYTAGIGAIVAAGGTTNVPVTCDGTNWRIGANDNVPAHLMRKFS